MKNAVAQNIPPVGIALMLATVMTSLIVRVPITRAEENPTGRAGASPVRNLWPVNNLESAVGDSAQPSQADASLRGQVGEASEVFQNDFVAILGQSADLPVACDWDGDGDDNFGAFRPSSGTFLLSTNNASCNPGFSFGAAGDLPVAGDWDGKP